MKRYLYPLILIIFASSCTRPEPKVTSTIVIGRIIDSVTQINIRHTAFVLYSDGDYRGRVRSTPFSTDSNGRFMVIFDIEEGSTMKLCWPNGLSGPYTYNPRYEIASKPAPKGTHPYGLDFGEVFTKL